MAKTISIVGTGWLGFPLVMLFSSKGCYVKASTTSVSRLQELSTYTEPFLLDIKQLPNNLSIFLQADILIINIPSKDVNGFRLLIKEIEKSEIKNVLFIGSTSVYKNVNKIIDETDTDALIESPLLEIENCFQENSHFNTTIVRFGGLIGYDRNPGNFFQKGRLLKAPESNVNLIHRDDCINIIYQIVEQDVWGEVFNCCADTHPTKKDFYTQAAIKIGVTIPRFEESSIKAFKVISNKKVKRVLKYSFLYPDLLGIINQGELLN